MDYSLNATSLVPGVEARILGIVLFHSREVHSLRQRIFSFCFISFHYVNNTHWKQNPGAGSDGSMIYMSGGDDRSACRLSSHLHLLSPFHHLLSTHLLSLLCCIASITHFGGRSTKSVWDDGFSELELFYPMELMVALGFLFYFIILILFESNI